MYYTYHKGINVKLQSATKSAFCIIKHNLAREKKCA